MENKQPIGVFDSGIGGLSVLKQLIRFLPYENYIYLGDTARVPYGNKTPEIVKKYAKECTKFLLEKNVKMVVVACNTASSVAMDAVKKAAGDLPVIGMINPAAGAALRQSVNGKIGVIGTRATINSNAYSDAIYSLANNEKVKVVPQACPLFVPIVEEGLTRHEISKLMAQDYFFELQKEKIDTLVLGCTHYPLLSHLFTEILPGVSLIDSGEHASVTALRLLAENEMLREERNEFIIKPEIDFYVTDLPAMFHDLAKSFLGFKVESPNTISLGN